MYGTTVGVLRGGPSREHDISLLSGHAVVANLPRDRFTVRDIYIDKKGEWYERGKVHAPSDILRTIDVVLSTLHGEYGESGELQRMFERHNLPYVGSDSLNSYMALHKVLAKEKAKEMGIKTPKYYLVQSKNNLESITYEVVRTFSQPVVIKPVTGSSSIGLEVAGGYAQIYAALSKLLSEDKEALIEEMARGTEASVGVIEGFRGEALYVLPPIEITPIGLSREIIPGRFSKEIQKELMNAAKTMHESLGQKHYSRSDFIVSKSGVQFLELNSAVATTLTKESLLPKSLASVGVSLPEFLSHVIDRAMLQTRPLF